MYEIFLVFDKKSWIYPYIKELHTSLLKAGHRVIMADKYSDVKKCDISFFLGCTKIAPAAVLAMADRNLIVHESALPEGKGFAPMSWQILDGIKKIPVCLCEADENVDSGNLIYLDYIYLEGHELHDEWRHLQGLKTTELCERFVQENPLPVGEKQTGTSSFYPKRTPKDSCIDINKTIAEQFDLLRIVSNEDYPAFFFHQGHKYILKIEKDKNE